MWEGPARRRRQIPPARPPCPPCPHAGLSTARPARMPQGSEAIRANGSEGRPRSLHSGKPGRVGEFFGRHGVPNTPCPKCSAARSRSPCRRCMPPLGVKAIPASGGSGVSSAYLVWHDRGAGKRRCVMHGSRMPVLGAYTLFGPLCRRPRHRAIEATPPAAGRRPLRSLA